MKKYVSRSGEKLEFALNEFHIDVRGKTCADFGSSTGGFSHCLLDYGAKKIYAVDVAYGEFHYSLRNRLEVVLLERQNAMHIKLPEKVDLMVCDVGWTKQEKFISNVCDNLKESGDIITLVKPHYEAKKHEKSRGVVNENFIEDILCRVEEVFKENQLCIIQKGISPVKGRRGKNQEWLYYLKFDNVR